MKVVIIIALFLSTLCAEEYDAEKYIKLAKGLGWNEENCSIAMVKSSIEDYEITSLQKAKAELAKKYSVDVNNMEYIFILRRDVGKYCISAICIK